MNHQRQENQDEMMLSPICWRQEDNGSMVIDDDSPPQTADYLLLQQELSWSLPLPFQPFSGASPFPLNHKTHAPPPTQEDHILYPREDVNCRTRFTTMLSVYSNDIDVDTTSEDCWYTKEDLAAFKAERKGIVKRLKRVDWDASRIDQTKYELRGLEAYSSVEFNALMQTKRKEVIDGVLREQQLQDLLGTPDVDRIRAASAAASAWARSRAIDLGNSDAMHVGCVPSPSQLMDESSSDDSIPALSRLSCSSASSSSIASMDFSWAEKLMGEELIPDEA